VPIGQGEGDELLAPQKNPAGQTFGLTVPGVSQVKRCKHDLQEELPLSS